jgi:hypothetical protein
VLTSPNSNQNLNNLLKLKDEEIAKLKEENEILKVDNKLLQEEINTLSKRIKIDETIENLEKSMKNNLFEIESTMLSYSKNLGKFAIEDNMSIKQKLNEKDKKCYDEIQNLLKKEFQFVND